MRYRVSDLPAKGVGAFMPLPTLGPAASSRGLTRVTGSPGTTPTPSPRPGFLPSLTAQGGVNSAQPGLAGSPDVFLPSVYVVYADNQGPSADAGLGMAARRTNPLPVPSMDANRQPNLTGVAKPARMGGRQQVPWPRAFQRFPNWQGSGRG